MIRAHERVKALVSDLPKGINSYFPLTPRHREKRSGQHELITCFRGTGGEGASPRSSLDLARVCPDEMRSRSIG